MKKTLSILTILMFIFATLAVAQSPPVPQPVRGYLTLNGASLTGYIIDVTNTQTGQRISGDDHIELITQPGGFAFDLSFFTQGFTPPIPNIGYPGDTLVVSVRGLSDPQATVSFIPSGSLPTIRIDIINEQTVFQCFDGSFVVNQNDCPVPEEVVEDEPEEPALDVETKVTASEDRESASVDVFYGQGIDIKLDDNKIAALIDTEIYYDGEHYDVKEEVYFAGVVQTSIDDDDFGTNPYLVVKEGDIEYRYIFEEHVPVEDFHIEEPLDIVFLGREVKIIEASANEIVLRSGTEYFKKEGDSFDVLGYTVTVETIGEDSVLIDVDGGVEIINDGSDREINGLRVLVENILYKDYEGPGSFVELVIGVETDEVVKSGDDFELFVVDSEEYEWVIELGGENQYIGVVNQETYNNIDDDEDYKAIGVGDSVSLPNNFVTVNFKSITSFDSNDLSFKLKDGYLYVKGSEEDTFNFGSTDHDRLYINSEGIHDEDKVFITNDKVEIGDSDIFLEMGSVKIRDLTIKLDMSDILFKGVSFALKDETFMDYLGIIFRDPEQGVDDHDNFKVSVPEDRPEALVVFNLGVVVEVVVPVEEPEVEEEEEIDVVVPVDEPVIPIVTPPIVEPPVAPPVLPPVVDDDVEEEVDSLFDRLFQLAIKILAVFGFGAGFLGLVNHYWKGGQKLRAIKMLNTAITKALLGKYDKHKK